jgi:trypsin
MLHAITLISAGRLRRAACAASLIFGFGVAPPVSAQDPSGSNWAREYVQLRVLSRTIRAMGADAARAAGSDLRALLRPRIVGGTTAGAGDNPFQVALLVRSDNNNQAAQFCGGTLVRPNFVVTAAHCSDFVRADQVQVLTGTRRLDGTGVRRDVLRIVIHPSWNAITFDNDVAVWQLSTGAAGISLATLATDDGTIGSNLLVTGWGLTTEGGTSPVDLQRVEVPLVDRTNCNDANSYSGDITNRMLCAGLDAGGRDSCQGDSGGPLTRRANNATLTGIVSWGTGCARPNLYGVYTRVSEVTIRNFIKENIPGDPAVFVVDGQATQHVVYRGDDGHIHELWWDATQCSQTTCWHHGDLTEATGAGRAAGDPAGYMFVVGGQPTQHVVYRGDDGHIHELWWDATQCSQTTCWHHGDLTEATGAAT